MDSLLLFFSLCFPLAAGHDLLDQTPTEAYWKAKHVTVSGESMLIQLRRLPVAADAARLIQDLGNPDFSARERATQALIDAGGAVAAQVQQATLSDDPEVAMRAKRIARLLQLGACEAQVRRLMAVRALGELRHVAARPTLEKLAADETDPELALYARRALGELSNPPGPTPPCQIPRRSRAELESDLELLPAASLGVLQVSLAEPLKAPLNAELDFKPFFGKGVPVLEREPRYLAKLIVLVDSLGYARIDTVTASLAHEGAEKPAAVTCVARGKWDRAALRELLEAGGFQFEKVAELEVGTLQDTCQVALFSDERLLVAFGDLSRELPLKSLTAGGDAPGLLRRNERIWTLVEQAPRERPLWGVLLRTELLGEIPWLEPVQHLTLYAEQAGPAFTATIDATIANPREKTAQIAAALKEFEKMLDKAEPESGQIAAMFRCAKPLADLMTSLETARTETGVRATMNTPDLAPLLVLPLVLSSNQWLK